MKKLLISALAVTVGIVLAPAGFASAQDDEPTVEGTGWLAAKGSGSADIDMGGRLRVRVDGDVILTDHAGDMKVDLRGGSDRTAEATEDGADVILNDYVGRIRVQGTDFSIQIDGEVKLVARGRGQAWLEGQGIYKTRRGDPMVWDGMVELGGAEVQPAA